MKKIIEFPYGPCVEHVEYPVLLYRKQYGFHVWMQWYGQTDNCDLSDKQFLFPLNCSLKYFCGCPEDFEVIMIGPVKNWNHGSKEYLVQKFGDENMFMVHFISPVHTAVGSIAPLAGIIPLNIKIFDVNYGIINPQEFLDDSVRVAIMEEFFQRNN